MKTQIHLCSFLLFSLLVASAANANVFDTDGQVLRTGQNYYVVPVIWAMGGGLKLHSQGTNQCPLGVVQDPFEVNRGTPVTFLPLNPNEQTIRPSSDLNIKFADPTKFLCAYKNNGQPTVWRLVSGPSGQLFVSTGGAIGNPCNLTIQNWFRIERLPGPHNWYKFVHCPQVCNTCRPVCGDLGIVYDKSGIRRLALNTGTPFQVVFVKA